MKQGIIFYLLFETIQPNNSHKMFSVAICHLRNAFSLADSIVAVNECDPVQTLESGKFFYLANLVNNLVNSGCLRCILYIV